jgi:predicted negative regulator of RcsB-dependent stress response
LVVKKIKVTKKASDKASDLLSLTERWDFWLQKNSKYLIGGIVLLVAVGGIVWGVSAYRQSVEARAKTAYVGLLAKLPAEGGEDSKEWEKLIPELETFVQTHAGTKAAIDAEADLVQACVKVKRYADAIKWSNQILVEITPAHPLRPIIREQLAVGYEAMGKTDDAIQQWTEMKKEGSGSFARVISWNLGRLYARKGDYGKAKEEYEAALKTDGAYPGTALLEDEMARMQPQAAPSTDGPKKEPSKGNS